MNSIVLFVTVAAAVLITVKADDDHDHKEEFKQIEALCEKETGVDFELITKAEQGEFEEGNDLKCFPKCFFEKAKWMSAEGKIDEAAVIAVAEEKDDKDVRVPIVKKCIKKEGKDACETAYLVFRCYWEDIKAAGLKK